MAGEINRESISGSGVGRDEAYERAERGLQEGSQRSGVGHGLQEPDVLVEPDWSHGMEKGHRGGESRSVRARVWGSLGHMAPVECRVCTRSGRSKGRGETGTESERTLNVRLRREGVMWHPGSVSGFFTGLLVQPDESRLPYVSP